MKKAFTLIELIATIVILGVVTSIVSILIMNVIRNVKDSARKRSIDNYGRIIETSMAEYQSQYIKYPDSIDQLELEYVGSVVECGTRRINPDKTIYLSECKVNGKKVLDKNTEDGYYHYGQLVLTNEEYVDKLGKNIEVALKDYYKENNKYPINYRLLNLPKLAKDVNCVSHINSNGTVYLTKCSIDGSYILNENEEDGYYHYGEKIYDYVDSDGNRYIKVEYLESNGFQYIDTGLTTRENMKIDVKYYINNYNTERNYVFGVYGMDGVNYGYRMQWSHANNSFAGYGNLGVGNIKTDNSKNINNLLFSEGKFYLNDTLIYDASGASLVYSEDNDKNIYLFAVNGNGVISNFSSIRMYYMKMYEGNTLLRDYVPVIDKNKRPCLFDKVEKKCYYNQGIGEFNKYDHDDILVDKSNERYGKVNYIESTGTQSINTGLTTRENMKIDVKYYINNYEVTRNYVFGVYGAGNAYRMQWSQSNSSFAGYGNLYNSNIQSDNSNKLNHLVVDKGKFYLNDTMIYDASNASQIYSANNNASIYLFAVNGNGSVSNFSSIRIYYMKIYEGNTLLRDYTPVITSSGKACLFDKVSRECYYNQGTGEFLYG